MSLALKISSFNRDRKWNLFLKEIAPTEDTQILDVGFNEIEYHSTDNYLEKHYPYLENLTALGMDEPNQFKQKYPQVNAIQYDGNTFPFADNEFDVCWSNAVIEHVGQRDKQLYFLKEIKRVAKKAFITTPNRYFPVEPHTRTPLLHYLPKSIFDKYLTMTGQEWAAGDYMYMMSENELKTLLANAGITDYKIINNKLGGFTLDFVVIFN